MFSLFFMLLVLSWEVSCKAKIIPNAKLEVLDGSMETNNIKLLIHKYEEHLNTSMILDKNDKSLINSWTLDFQVKRVNITTKYRVQMSRHKEHSFGKNYSNAIWNACLDVHKNEIRRREHLYYENESNCLKTTVDEDKDRKRTVEQVGKEIRKWRKGYKYLLNLCNGENPDNEESAAACLVDYMQKDNYNTVIERLILLKLDAISELYLQMVTSMKHLEVCLVTNFSDYLESVRSLMDNLKKCYNLGT